MTTLKDKLKPEFEAYGQLAQAKGLIPQAMQRIGQPAEEGQPSAEQMIGYYRNFLASVTPRVTNMISPQSYANMPIESLVEFGNALQGTFLDNLVTAVDESPQDLFQGIAAKEGFEDKAKFDSLFPFVYQMNPESASEEYDDVRQALDNAKTEAGKYIDERGQLKEDAPNVYLGEFDDIPLIKSAVASYLGRREGISLIQDHVASYQSKVAECFASVDEGGNPIYNIGRLTEYLAGNYGSQEKPVKANIALGATDFYLAEPREAAGEGGAEAGEGEAELDLAA